MTIETTGRAVSVPTSSWLGGCALLCALMCGCADGPPPPGAVPESHTPATGPFKATGWFDAKGNPVSGDAELAAKTRCAEQIRDASTDQIHRVEAIDIDACLVRMGWFRGTLK